MVVAIATLGVFLLAVGFGVLLSMITGGGIWLGAAATLGFLILVVLPFRLWWVVAMSRHGRSGDLR